MTDVLHKLWASKSTLVILVWIAVFAFAYNLDYIKKPTIVSKPTDRTVEEIIATPVNNTPTQPWDTEFKSNVEATE